MLRVVMAEEPEVWLVAATSTRTSEPTTALLHRSSLAPNVLHGKMVNFSSLHLILIVKHAKDKHME